MLREVLRRLQKSQMNFVKKYGLIGTWCDVKKWQSVKKRATRKYGKAHLPSAERVIAQYGLENLSPYSKFDWGMLNGKLSVLRWVMGDDWDMLDT